MALVTTLLSNIIFPSMKGNLLCVMVVDHIHYHYPLDLKDMTSASNASVPSYNKIRPQHRTLFPCKTCVSHAQLRIQRYTHLLIKVLQRCLRLNLKWALVCLVSSLDLRRSLLKRALVCSATSLDLRRSLSPKQGLACPVSNSSLSLSPKRALVCPISSRNSH